MLKPHPVIRAFLWITLLAVSGCTLVLSATLLYLGPKLPAVEQILDIQLQTPLRIYSSERKLIAEFGEKKRSPIDYEDTPEAFINAVLAAEDARFFKHHGVDLKGLTRASLELLSTGSIQTGGSTITMQVAKNYFLSRERTFLRKFNEILLALDIERKLSKEQILELYINKIYLGHRAYGIQAAAQVYYGKPVDELSLAQLATIAGLPKAPSAYNPITNPARALVRRNWILSRMQELNYISHAEMVEALAEPPSASLHGTPVEVDAPYFAEMIRRDMNARFGEKSVTDGYKVYTSLNATFQQAAQKATRNGLIAYDQRHGFRGPEARIAIDDSTRAKSLLKELKKFRTIDDLEPAIIVLVSETEATALTKAGDTITIAFDTMKWARKYIDNNRRGPAPKQPEDVVAVGDIIRISQQDNQWHLSQLPSAQSALISLNPNNGALLAVIGGFDFNSSKFNRAIQGGRQAGSSFKPFIYSAALSKGMTPATIINDAPVVFNDASLESTWRPENSGGRFFGPTRLREALYRSRNLVSIRVLRRIGIENTINYATRFGFNADSLPKNLTLALGSAALTPWELAKGYAVLANGGFKVEPWYIERIEDKAGNAVYESNPAVACDKVCREEFSEEQIQAATETSEQDNDSINFDDLLKAESLEATPADAPTADSIATPEETAPIDEPPPIRFAKRVQNEQVNFLITNMMQDVIKRGTAIKAKALERADLAGKTGTTNDQKDAWFSGFNREIVTTVWVGFDQPQTLGRREYGGTAALPIWMDYMKVALSGLPETPLPIPDGIITVRIDPKTGKRATPSQSNAIFEYFREQNAPKERAEQEVHNPYEEQDSISEQLF